MERDDYSRLLDIDDLVHNQVEPGVDKRLPVPGGVVAAEEHRDSKPLVHEARPSPATSAARNSPPGDSHS